MINKEHKKCPYCYELIKAKAIKCKHCKAMLDNTAISKSDSLAIRPDKVPEDVLQLIWFSDGPYANFSSQAEHVVTLTAEGYIFEISMMGAIEPSLNSMELPIIIPKNITEVEPLTYYPSYSLISPQQRWIYLTWLRNIESAVDIGYVFIFYYGLERHLFFGKFEAAFDMILRLRVDNHKLVIGDKFLHQVTLSEPFNEDTLFEVINDSYSFNQ